MKKLPTEVDSISYVHIWIPLLSDCCRFIRVQYNDNSTHAYEPWPYIFQVFEIQDEPLNERSYYVGTVDDSKAIGFADCGLWLVQPTSMRSVKLQLSEQSNVSAIHFNREQSNFYHVIFVLHI